MKVRNLIAALIVALAGAPAGAGIGDTYFTTTDAVYRMPAGGGGAELIAQGAPYLFQISAASAFSNNYDDYILVAANGAQPGPGNTTGVIIVVASTGEQF